MLNLLLRTYSYLTMTRYITRQVLNGGASLLSYSHSPFQNLHFTESSAQTSFLR